MAVIIIKPQFKFITETATNLSFNVPNKITIDAGTKVEINTPIIENSNTDLGFYNIAGTPQAAAPVTLADVILILQNLGLTQ